MVAVAQHQLQRVFARRQRQHRLGLAFAEMQVLGDYHSLGAFLQKIRELPRIVNVGKLKVDSRSGPGPDGTPLTIGATYEATTFVYREISDTAETVKAKK